MTSKTSWTPASRGADERRALPVRAAFRLWQSKLRIEGIEIILPDGSRLPAGRTQLGTLQLVSWRAAVAFALRDHAGFFEHYLDGNVHLLPCEASAAEVLLEVVGAFDTAVADLRLLSAALHSSRFAWQKNTRYRRAALAVHYSVDPRFWIAFMSEEYPIYSHYLFEPGEAASAWEAACQRKLEFAFQACHMRAGDRVLNIGEGWGGWLTFAGRRGVHVTGLTLNRESYAACIAKREREGLRAQSDVYEQDFFHYRAAPFDAITNMGVTEHLTDYGALMRKYAELLKPGGLVYADFVGSTLDEPFGSLTQKFVYPGATPVYLPRLLDAAARSGFFDVITTHDDRRSYELTCRAWAQNVERQRDYLVTHFGERRYRWLWSYLWMCVYGFRSYEKGLTGTRVVMRRR